MNAVIRQPSYDNLEFVRHHVRRISANLGVDEVYQDIAVFEAEAALRGGSARDVAVHAGVESAARVRVAGRAHVHGRRERPKLRLVPRLAPAAAATGLRRSDFNWEALLSAAIASAILIGAVLHGVAS